jgi:putative FmdB family regulatory protein
MPIYEYEREDGTIFEVMQKISEDALEACPDTGQKVRRIISQNAFHLKGGGWYKTDYSSSSASKTKKSDSSEASNGSEGGSGSDSAKSASSESSSGCSTGCACH